VQETYTPEKYSRVTPAKENYKNFDSEYFSPTKFDEIE
jgi:hypothetical protein